VDLDAGSWCDAPDCEHPPFYFDGVALSGVAFSGLSPVDKTSMGARGTIAFSLRERRQPCDRVVALEFVLFKRDMRFPLGRKDDLEIADGKPARAFSRNYWVPKDTLSALTADGSVPRLRISMIVFPDCSSEAPQTSRVP